MFVRNLFMQANVLNLPVWIICTASCTGLESGISRIGCFDYLSSGYFDSIATAIARFLVTWLPQFAAFLQLARAESE